jgi:hypothetical protein
MPIVRKGIRVAILKMKHPLFRHIKSPPAKKKSRKEGNISGMSQSRGGLF